MSLNDIDKIPRTVAEVREALEGASMEYGNAISASKGLNAIEAIALRVAADHAEEVKAQIDIIEGLLAGWPHTEIVRHYTPAERPVLTKEEALKRAAILIKSQSNK